MALINEERLSERINQWSGGRILLAVGAALAAGIVIGGLFF